VNVKGVKEGVERLPVPVLMNIADVIHRRATTRVLLSNDIKIPYKLEGTFVILLADINLVGCALEVADELVTVCRANVGFENVEYRVKSSPWFSSPGGISRGFSTIARWVLFEQSSGSLECSFKAFH
jgi:hypothetical protein